MPGEMDGHMCRHTDRRKKLAYITMEADVQLIISPPDCKSQEQSCPFVCLSRLLSETSGGREERRKLSTELQQSPPPPHHHRHHAKGITMPTSLPSPCEHYRHHCHHHNCHYHHYHDYHHYHRGTVAKIKIVLFKLLCTKFIHELSPGCLGSKLCSVSKPKQPDGQPVGRSVGRSVGQSVGRSLAPLIGSSVGRSVGRSSHQMKKRRNGFGRHQSNLIDRGQRITDRDLRVTDRGHRITGVGLKNHGQRSKSHG